LIYTAVTRGKRLVVIVGQKKAMAIAVKARKTNRRWSKLSYGVAGVGSLGIRPAATSSRSQGWSTSSSASCRALRTP
jgi:hypothetical protein